MLTDPLDNTDARRKREAAIGPVILYGSPSLGEIAQARGAGRGVLIVSEELRDGLVGVHPGFEDDGLVSSEWLDERKAETERERVTDQEEHTHYTERASRLCAEGDHDSAELWDRDAERIKVREAEKAEQNRIWREDGVVDITRHTEDTLFKAASAAQKITDPQTANDIINEMLNAGILFREPAPGYEPVPADEPEYTWVGDGESGIPEWREREKMFESREATLDLLWKRGVIDEQRHHRLRQQLREEFGYDQGELAENEMAVQAEEPIEDRLTRAWLNGFREGFERRAYIGRPDHS